MAKDIRHYLSKRLRELRHKAELAQEEFAKRSGISVKYLQNLESSDPKNPTLETLDKLAKGMNIKLV